ncbi:site-specific integrase [Ferruginibacter profundus]
MLKQHPFLPLFQKFIGDSSSGKRLNKNGTRIKPQSVNNYRYACKLVEEFAAVKKFNLVIYEVKGNNKREHATLKSYWKKFYKQFTAFLHTDKGCFDNYTGQTIKQVRTFFNWLNNELGIATGPFHKSFYVPKEMVAIVTLSVQQLQFLIYDTDFEQSLSAALQRSKDFFVFGCTVGLRFSDLVKLKKQNIETRDGNTYLKVRSQKTATDTMVKLPPHAIAIVAKYKKLKTGLLPTISLFRFNANLKKMAALAGWTDPVPKLRTVRGVGIQQKSTAPTRFCDCVSSHTMRRTSITTMLTSGMPEHVVRKISGHTNDSKAFFRYVNLAQSLMDVEIDKMHSRFNNPATMAMA